MEHFKWKDQFSVQIPEMDRQHQKFFQMLNRIQEYQGKAGGDPQFLDDLFRDLCAYVLTHFADEEALLEQTGFEGLETQRKQHQYFREELVKLREQHFNGRVVVSQGVLNFMRDWFLNHVLEEDKRYGQYFKNIK